MKDAKEMEKEFNAVKHDLLQKTVKHGMTTTSQLIDKTKDKESAIQMAGSAMRFHNLQEKIDMLPGKELPDIKMKGGTGAPIAEPSVEITYPNLMNRVFYQGDPIHMVFDAKNVKKPYYCFVYANTSGVLTRLFVSPRPIRFDHHEIPNILINRQLPIGKHEIFVSLYGDVNNGRKKLLDSKGRDVVDSTQKIMGIEIKPPKTGTTGTVDPKTGKPIDPEDKKEGPIVTIGDKKKKKFKKEDIEPAKIVPHKQLEESDPPKQITKGANYPVVSATPLIEITMHDTIEGDRPQPLTFTVHNANMYGRINFDYTIDIWTLANPVGMNLTTDKFVSHDYSNLFHEESSINIKRTDIDLSRINPQFTDNGLELPKLIVIIVKDNNTGHVAKHIRKILVAHSSVNGAKLD